MRVAVELRDATLQTLLGRPPAGDGTFELRANLDRPGLVLVAVRGTTTSKSVPVTGAMSGVRLTIPD